MSDREPVPSVIRESDRGVGASELFHFAEGGQTPGPDPERQSYNTFCSFEDPDGNTWLVQEVKRGAAA